jgi:hypothetical protein
MRMSSFPPRRSKRKPFDFDEFLKRLKLPAFDLGMTIVLFVVLYRVAMHEIAR